MIGKHPTGDLHGRTALVTGASRGIGYACARTLGDAGVRLALVSRSPDALERAQAELPGAEIAVPCDLAGDGAARMVADAVIGHFDGKLDILVNNAGIVLNRRTHRLADGDVDTLLRTNVRAALMLSAAIAPVMVEGGSGAIVNVGSINGTVGLPFSAAYAASKSALDGLTRACAAEWGPFGVRVNSVCPGVIETDMWAEGRESPGVVERVSRQVALRRWGTAQDVANVVAFLASDAASYVTAQVLAVDGGLASTTDLLGRPDLDAPATTSGEVVW